MKITIGHHVELKGLTDEQYHAFCQKAIKDGAKQGEHRSDGSVPTCWKHVGIDEANKIMLYEKIKSQYAKADACFNECWNGWKYIGVRNGHIYYADTYFNLFPNMLLTIDQALDEENKCVCECHNRHKDLFDAITELKAIKEQIEKLQEREAEISEFIADDLEL